MTQLDSFSEVREIYQSDHNRDGYRGVALIIPAVSDGRARYHVYRLDLLGKSVSRIGCELPLQHARAIANRPMARDYHPVTPAEMRAGRGRR